MDAGTIGKLARELHEAEKTRRLTRLFSARFPEMTVADAYAIQRAWIEIKVSEGRQIIGHKIGLTSRAMQQAGGLNEPDYGVLLDDMQYEGGAEIPLQRFIAPRLENELAFILNKPLRGPRCTIFDVLSATEYVIPALEIIDLRMPRVDPEKNQPRKIVDTISDNAANAAYVIGGRPIRPLDLDLRWVGAICHKNNVIEESGLAAAVLNHPANGIAWLANKLALHGDSLAAGELVMAGSFTRPTSIAPGDTFYVDYGPLGSISCRFVGEA
jgi:2-oxo-hept-3-ene-1,7-dioate hydratase